MLLQQKLACLNISHVYQSFSWATMAGSQFIYISSPLDFSSMVCLRFPSSSSSDPPPPTSPWPQCAAANLSFSSLRNLSPVQGLRRMPSWWWVWVKRNESLTNLNRLYFQGLSKQPRQLPPACTQMREVEVESGVSVRIPSLPRPLWRVSPVHVDGENRSKLEQSWRVSYWWSPVPAPRRAPSCCQTSPPPC